MAHASHCRAACSLSDGEMRRVGNSQNSVGVLSVWSKVLTSRTVEEKEGRENWKALCWFALSQRLACRTWVGRISVKSPERAGNLRWAEQKLTTIDHQLCKLDLNAGEVCSSLPSNGR